MNFRWASIGLLPCKSSVIFLFFSNWTTRINPRQFKNFVFITFRPWPFFGANSPPASKNFSFSYTSTVTSKILYNLTGWFCCLSVVCPLSISCLSSSVRRLFVVYPSAVHRLCRLFVICPLSVHLSVKARYLKNGRRYQVEVNTEYSCVRSLEVWRSSRF